MSYPETLLIEVDTREAALAGRVLRESGVAALASFADSLCNDSAVALAQGSLPITAMDGDGADHYDALIDGPLDRAGF